MIYNMYSVRDSVSDRFFYPEPLGSDAEAMRNFDFCLSDPKGVMRFSVQDYDLFCVGVFDTDSGEIVPTAPPRLVCSGASFHDRRDKVR